MLYVFELSFEPFGPSTAGIRRIEPVDVDANMVVVYVLEFIITVGVELNSKEVVGHISVVCSLMSPMYCIGIVFEKFLCAATRKSMP